MYSIYNCSKTHGTILYAHYLTFSKVDLTDDSWVRRTEGVLTFVNAFDIVELLTLYSFPLGPGKCIFSLNLQNSAQNIFKSRPQD